MQRATLRAALALAFVFLAACASTPTQPTPTRQSSERSGDVRGCLAIFIRSENTYRFEPFLKVASKDSFSEDGKPEVWGFRLWNLETPDAKGLTAPVNALEENFIPLDKFKVVGPRAVKCPPYWRNSSGVSAANR